MPVPEGEIYVLADVRAQLLSHTGSFYLASGHPLRRFPCIVCREAIGGYPAVTMAITIMRPCDCGRAEIPGAITLRHAKCTEPAPDALLSLMQSELEKER